MARRRLASGKKFQRRRSRATHSTSPRRGEVGALRAPGEGENAREIRAIGAPSPQPSPRRGGGARRVRGESSSLLRGPQLGAHFVQQLLDLAAFEAGDVVLVLEQ